jgi:hypothetical protein
MLIVTVRIALYLDMKQAQPVTTIASNPQTTVDAPQCGTIWLLLRTRSGTTRMRIENWELSIGQISSYPARLNALRKDSMDI